MKKIITLIVIFLTLISCGITQQNSNPDYVLGMSQNQNRKMISTDSLHIVTPGIEIYEYVNDKSSTKYDQREIVKRFIIETLKSELNKSDYYDLPLMSKDYLSVNKVLERITYEKYKNPNWIVRAPNEVLIKEKKYTILITMTASYGDSNRGVMYFSVINNESKIIESVDRYDFNNSPLNNQKTENRIKKALLKITNT